MRRSMLAAALALALAAPAQAATQPIAGGATFNTAATVSPGTYADSLLPGTVSVYRLGLGPGQRMAAQVKLDVAAAAPTEANALQVSAAVYGPLRDRLAEGRASGAADPLTHAKAISVEGPRTNELGNWYLVVSSSPQQGQGAAPELPLSVTFATPAAPAPARAGEDHGRKMGWPLAAGLALIALVAGVLGGVSAGRLRARRSDRS